MMCKKLLSVTVIALVGIVISGCAPRWAQEDVRVVDEREKAIFSIGSADPELGEEDVRMAAANIRARTNLRIASLEYAEDFLLGFIEANEGWFDMDEVNALLAEFESTLKGYARLSGKIVDSWVDSGGRIDGRGVTYVRARQDLGDDFFDAIRESAVQAMEAQSDDLLKVELDTVISALDETIEKALGRPFDALIFVSDEPDMVEAEEDPVVEEVTEDAEAEPQEDQEEKQEDQEETEE